MKKIILSCLLILTLLLLIGCKAKEKESELTPPPVPPPVEVPATVPHPSEAQTSTTSGVEMISEVKCIDNKIELVMTNPTNETLTLAKNPKIILNGRFVVSDPECDSLEIAPGKSVYCADITGHFPIYKGETNKIQFNLRSGRSINEIYCPAEE